MSKKIIEAKKDPTFRTIFFIKIQPTCSAMPSGGALEEANQIPEPNIQPVAFNTQNKNKALATASHGLIMIGIMILNALVQTSISQENLIANPWLTVPRFFPLSFTVIYTIPGLSCYWNKDMWNHCKELVYDIFNVSL